MSARELATQWSRLDAPTRERELAALRTIDGPLANAVEALLAPVSSETAAQEKSGAVDS